jgi:hypothetical protein
MIYCKLASLPFQQTFQKNGQPLATRLPPSCVVTPCGNELTLYYFRDLLYPKLSCKYCCGFLPGIEEFSIMTPENKFDFEKMLGRIFIVLLATSLTLIVADRLSINLLRFKKTSVEAEFSARNIRNPEPYIMFKGSPHAKAWKLYSPQTGYRDNILNELGYPGEAPKMPKPKNEYRVIVLGGSAVFMGNPAIPRLIQYQFEKKGCPDVKVYNFGVVSSVSSMELARLIFDAVNYAPDLIISFSGFNDIDQPFVADPRPGYPLNFFIYESNPVLESDIRKYPLFPLLAYGSNLLRYFCPAYFSKRFTDLETIKKNAGYGSTAWRERIATTYIDNLIKSQKITRAFGADFLAFFQPSLYFKDVLSEEEKPLLETSRRENSLELREMIRKKAQKAVNEEGLRFIDLSDHYDSYHETVFKDRVHLQYLYQPDIATAVYQHILIFFTDTPPAALTAPSCR